MVIPACAQRSLVTGKIVARRRREDLAVAAMCSFDRQLQYRHISLNIRYAEKPEQG